jgi:hypothetical protein
VQVGADGSATNLRVCSRTTSAVVVRCARQLGWIDPEHRVITTAEQQHRPHAGDAQQIITHIELRVVAQVQRVTAVVWTDQMRTTMVRFGLLFGGDADLAFVSQQQGPVDTVLHCQPLPGLVPILKERPSASWRRRPWLRVKVQHVFNTVDLLFQGRCDCF